MTARPDFRRAAARRARTAVLAAAAMLSGAGLAAGQARSGLPTGPTTGPVVLPAAAQGLQEPPAVPPAPAGPEKVHVRRLSDVVAVREGPRASERVLYYFNPNLMLSQSDHVEQGSGGQSELTLPGGATLQMHATAHVELSLLSPEGDVLRFPLLTRVEAAVLDRPLDLILPGGTQV
ncbi:MAG TPA: hypothetical protein VK824_08205, partial [Planctomycetota bacterium]|nr:hypothetical protein [Planctomycetota bacterium]